MIAKIAAADLSLTNLNDAGTHWVQAKQVTTRRSLLYKATFTNLTETDYFAWFYNLAAGASNSPAPVMVRPITAGVCDTWDFPTGKLFSAGIYILFATALPTDPTTVPTGAGDDQVILSVDVRYHD